MDFSLPTDSASKETGGSNLHSMNTSRAGTPVLGAHHDVDGNPDLTHTTMYYRYGDECFYGKVSLLHFIIFFLLGGLTVIIVGAVQFKSEAGLAYLR